MKLAIDPGLVAACKVYGVPLGITACTIYGEARGEFALGMRGVGCVIFNRAHHPCWWGGDPVSVCLDPWQFSCWNENDPNRAKLLKVSVGLDPIFAEAVEIARETLAGPANDPTGGADSYFATSLEAPAWTHRARHTATIYHHSFWQVQGAKDGTVTPAAPDGAPAAPTRSVNAPALTADDLMQAELEELRAA